jgi:succinate-acetate transporter protein
MPKLGWVEAANATAMAYYLMMWGIFTFFLFLGTFRISVALQVVFGTLVILFFLLAYGDATGNATIKTIAGYEGIVCGASAIYTGMASLLNEVYGKTVMPIGAVKA